jgi:hypothetical protein
MTEKWEEKTAMPSDFTDRTAPSLQEGLPKLPRDLPHGLLEPPERVREWVAREKAKFAAEVFTAEVEGRLLNEWTLQYYFDELGYEVSYRPTPRGPVVLAVGDEERLALRREAGEEEYRKLHTWMP